MKTYLGSSKYSLLEIPPLLDSSQDLTISEDNALKLCLRVMAISKLSITRQAINYYVVGRDKKLAHAGTKLCSI
jgi:DNA polymerase III psi subunit